MAIKIALAGNPNCGKTTLFNALTGSNQFVGNWPGVTVEKKEGKLKKQYGGNRYIIYDEHNHCKDRQCQPSVGHDFIDLIRSR